jgi:glutathione S-transferase
MQLVTSLTSPFGRKINILLAEKGIACELVEDIPWNADTRVPALNPLGKVPVLVLDDGTTLFDSRVIAEYLDGLPTATNVPRLLPADDAARIRVRRWEALADGIGDAAATIFVERKRPAQQQSGDWIARQHGKIEAALDEAERLLPGDHCVGNTLTLADIALTCALGYLQLRFREEIPLSRWPRLQAWHQSQLGRTSVAATVAPG